MPWNWSVICALFHTEIRMVLRDRRTVITSLVIPLLVMPIMLFGSNWSVKKRERQLHGMVYRYAVTGSQTASVRALLKATLEYWTAGKKSQGNAEFKFEEVTGRDATNALNKGDIHFVLEGLTAEEARASLPETNRKREESKRSARASSPPNSMGSEDEESNGEAPLTHCVALRLLFRADRDDSAAGMRRMDDALRETRRTQRVELLQQRGFPVPPTKVAAVSDVNVATEGQVAGLTLGRIITLLLLLFILFGGAVVATDSLAGEKERGTLETLLTTAASRVDIVAAKHLVILAVALVITLTQAANLLVYVGFKLIPVPANFAAAVPPSVAVLLFLLYLPVAALASSVLLLTSGYAKTYKEAQLYFFPVFMLGLLPALAPFLPGLSLRSAIVLVPVANIALAAKEILVGSFDWPMIAVSWLVTAATALWAARLGVRFLSTEKLITAAETDAVEFAGGPALFSRRVLLWFALLWGITLMVNNYIATADVRVQLLINLVGLFFGAALLMLWRYRLHPREALALRPPQPAVWAALILAIPSGLVSALGLFQLANFFLPVPPKMIEAFSQNVVPEDIPLGQLLFFLGLLPGVFEEFTFRGLLLHGLHRRLHPAALVAVVGLVFGLFHVALFRLVATAYLGLLLATVTLLTGSIYPAVVWHALHNILGLLAALHELPLDELDPASYFAATGLLIVALWIIWRHRTPYPGLRPWRRSA